MWELVQLGRRPDAADDDWLKMHVTRPMAIALAGTAILMATRFEFQLFRWYVFISILMKYQICLCVQVFCADDRLGMLSP